MPRGGSLRADPASARTVPAGSFGGLKPGDYFWRAAERGARAAVKAASPFASVAGGDAGTPSGSENNRLAIRLPIIRAQFLPPMTYLQLFMVLSLPVTGMCYAALGALKLPLAERLKLDEAKVGGLVASFGFMVGPIILLSGFLADTRSGCCSEWGPSAGR